VSWHKPISLIASVAAGAVLLAYLASCTGLDLSGLARLVLTVRPAPLTEIIVLLTLNTFLAGEKWRLADRRLGRLDGSEMPRATYFAWTAIGVGIGQFVPTQLSLVLCRSLGSHLGGGFGLARGAGLTLYEQLFDLLVAGLFGLASLCVLAVAGDGTVWAAYALAASAAGWAFCAFALPLLARASAAARPFGRLGARLETWSRSALLAPRLGQQLFALSMLRFAVLVMIAAVSAQAVPAEIPLWQLAAGLPLAVIGNALAITPGGLGLNEWGMSFALYAFGMPFATAAQWALVNRVLVAVAALGVAAAGFTVLAALRRVRPSPVA
jgi:hypothetical protein